MLLARPGTTSPPPLETATWDVAAIPGPMAGVLGFSGGAVVTLVAALLGARDAPLFGLALLAATAAVISATTTIAGAFAAAAPSWALWNGFLLNDLGQLTFDTTGLHGLIVITAPAVVVAVVATASRRWAAAIARSGPRLTSRPKHAPD